MLAQVPDLNAFVAGIPIVLKPQGTVTCEFPHLQRLFEGNQFDTIYHEHFSYFSLLTIEAIFAKHGLTVFDVEELWTHGGSLRIYARHTSDSSRRSTAALQALRAREIANGFDRIETYLRFEEQVRATKRKLLDAADRGQARGQEDRRLRRARQGQHAAQLLRHPHRLPRLHRRPKPLQTRPFLSGHAHPDPAPGCARRRYARTTS